MISHICATFLVLCQIHITDLQDYQTQFINQITKCTIEYNAMVDSPNRLPVMLVIAQSAFESDWGRSRFATEGNNYFGIREYNETEPHLHALENPSVMVKTYLTQCDSVNDYMELLTTHSIYKSFQTELHNQWFNDTININKLIDELDSYAENPNYKSKLKDIIDYLLTQPPQ